MPEYAFTFGASPCVIKTYVQVEIGGQSGYVAFSFVVEHDGYSLRLIGDRDGEALTVFARTEEAVLAQACQSLAHQFGPRSDVSDRPKTAVIRHVQRPARIDDRRAALTVVAQDTIRAGDYVVVTDKGATPLARAPWPGAGAILGRALEGIDTGRLGRVRDISSKASPDWRQRTEATRRVWALLERYTGWLKRDRTSASTRAAVDALGKVLEQRGNSEATAAAIARVSAEVERLHAVDLKQLFRNALHDLRLILDSPKDE